MANIDVFTAALKTNFVNGYNAIAEPAPIDRAILRIPSSARSENYPWLSPVAAFSRFTGYRRFAKISNINYNVPNLEFSSEFEVLNRDIRDDQTGGYMRKSTDLGKKGKLFADRACLINLGNGGSTLCFDGTNFFSSSQHTIGVAPSGAPPLAGGAVNDLTFTSTGYNTSAPGGGGTGWQADSKTHYCIGLFVGGEIKPLIWQDRLPPELQTNAGTPASSMAKVSRYWADIEGNAAFGWWWDAIRVTITNTPSIGDFQNILNAMDAQFRQFQQPKVLGTDTPEFMHEQADFNDKTFVVVCNPAIKQIAHSAVTLSLIANTENIFKGYATVIPSNLIVPSTYTL